MFHSHRRMYLGPYLGPRNSKFHFGPQKSTKNYMGYGYIPCEFLMLGPQIGPQIIIFENYITSSLIGTKNQFHILNGWDLSLCQVFMSENTLFSIPSSDPENFNFRVP